jgi:hypothetical protein
LPTLGALIVAGTDRGVAGRAGGKRFRHG